MSSTRKYRIWTSVNMLYKWWWPCHYELQIRAWPCLQMHVSNIPCIRSQAWQLTRPLYLLAKGVSVRYLTCNLNLYHWWGWIRDRAATWSRISSLPFSNNSFCRRRQYKPTMHSGFIIYYKTPLPHIERNGSKLHTVSVHSCSTQSIV